MIAGRAQAGDGRAGLLQDLDLQIHLMLRRSRSGVDREVHHPSPGGRHGLGEHLATLLKRLVFRVAVQERGVDVSQRKQVLGGHRAHGSVVVEHAVVGPGKLLEGPQQHNRWNRRECPPHRGVQPLVTSDHEHAVALVRGEGRGQRAFIAQPRHDQIHSGLGQSCFDAVENVWEDRQAVDRAGLKPGHQQQHVARLHPPPRRGLGPGPPR